ncbi:MAG: tetratricopeptide repeat protein [Sedimentisphaerales bacterium]|nr:tetratricopeptide repeat protein [Sedimentisphaerales bacterium]
MTTLAEMPRRAGGCFLVALICWAASGWAAETPTDELQVVSDPNLQGKRIAVAVLPFEDRTDDPNLAHWRHSADALLARQLRRVTRLRMLSEQADRYGVGQVGLHAGDPVDPNAARRIGEIIEAQRVIWGAYWRDHDQWRVEASVLNVATGHASRLGKTTGGDWLELADRLSECILTELGIVPSADERQKMAKRWIHSAEALEWYSRAYASQERAEPVLEQQRLMRRVLVDDPNCASALAGLASTLASEGKFSDAEDAVRRALQIDSELHTAYAVLGRLVMLQRQPAEAEKLIRQAWRLDPDCADYPTLLAQISMMQGKRDQAADFLEAAASLDRTNADVHASLALVYAIQGMSDQALEGIKEVERIKPEGVYALQPEQMLGQTCELLGRKSEAITHFERLVATAKTLKANPEMIDSFERKIERLKSDLTPTFINVPMLTSYTIESLSAALDDRLTDEEMRLAVNPLMCSVEMKAWTEELTEGADSDLDKAKALFDALSKRVGAVGLPAVRTAEEVFAAWSNPEVPLRCGDHAVLFVALARAAGLNAYYVYVSHDPHGRVIHHACAAVFADGRALLVDPSWPWFGAPHQKFEALDDLKTVAALCFARDQADTEWARCRAGLKLWPDSLFGKLCLVNALRRNRQFRQAKALLGQIPEPEAQSWNSYFYHSQQAAFALMQGDLNRAYESIQQALSVYPDGDSRHMLGTILLARGQLREAREEYRRTLRGRVDPDTAEAVRRRIAQINEQIGFEPVNVDPEPVQTP